MQIDLTLQALAVVVTAFTLFVTYTIAKSGRDQVKHLLRESRIVHSPYLIVDNRTTLRLGASNATMELCFRNIGSGALVNAKMYQEGEIDAEEVPDQPLNISIPPGGIHAWQFVLPLQFQETTRTFRISGESLLGWQSDHRVVVEARDRLLKSVQCTPVDHTHGVGS